MVRAGKERRNRIFSRAQGTCPAILNLNYSATTVIRAIQLLHSPELADLRVPLMPAPGIFLELRWHSGLCLWIFLSHDL